MTRAHEGLVTIRFTERWPAHEARAQDPHYKAFHAAKRRMERQGLLVCNVKTAEHYGQIELHHAAVEYAHVNDVDLMKFNEVYGLHLSDDQFKDFVEGAPGPNGECALEPLCVEHHRGLSGIHSLPGPDWNVLRVGRDDQRIFRAEANTEIPVDKGAS